MSISVHKKNLFDCIQKAYPIIPSKTTIPIVLNFKLTFKYDRLEITATDLDHCVRLSVPIQGDREHELTVNARKVFEIARELPDDEIVIDIVDNVLIFESGGSFTCKISGIDARDFPIIPGIDTSVRVTMPVSILKTMIANSIFAVSREETRACLTGVFWHIDKQKTGMVATDGHRLGSTYVHDSYAVENAVSMIVAPKSLQSFIRIFETGKGEELCSVSFNDKYVQFYNDTVILCSKLLEGPYPDYEKVIPRNNTKRAVVDRNVLMESVRRVSVLSNQKTHLVKFGFSTGTLEIEVLNRDIGGEAQQRIPVVYEGEPMAVGFNAIYFNEIIAIISSPLVRIEMSTPIGACLLFPHTDGEERRRTEDVFLIMPLRIIDDMQE